MCRTAVPPPSPARLAGRSSSFLTPGEKTVLEGLGRGEKTVLEGLGREEKTVLRVLEKRRKDCSEGPRGVPHAG